MRTGRWRGARYACLLLPFAGLGGCGGPRSQQPAVAPGSVSVIYQSQGTVDGLDMADGGLTGEVFVWESRGTHMSVRRPWEAVGGLQLLRLNLLSGEAKALYEDVGGDRSHLLLEIALSDDGRRMAASYRDAGTPEKYAVRVSSDSQNWRTVTSLDEYTRVRPRWSPDGRAVAFLSMDLEHKGLPSIEGVVVRLGMGDRPVEETVLTPAGGRTGEIVWAADGRRLYQVVHRPDADDYFVEALEWPSLERHTIVTGAGIGGMGVARKTGDVVWLEACGVETPDEDTDTPQQPVGRLWRLSPEGSLEETSVRVKGVSVMAVVSPDGRYLAVVPGDPTVRFRTAGNGLVVHSLADGTAHTYREFDHRTIVDVAWALEGQALVVAEGKKNVWLVGM